MAVTFRKPPEPKKPSKKRRVITWLITLFIIYKIWRYIWILILYMLEDFINLYYIWLPLGVTFGLIAVFQEKPKK